MRLKQLKLNVYSPTKQHMLRAQWRSEAELFRADLARPNPVLLVGNMPHESPIFEHGRLN